MTTQRLFKRVVFLALLLTAACSAGPYGFHVSSTSPGLVYLESNRAVWLTEEQSAYTACIDGQALVCTAAVGRLGEKRCRCHE